MICHVYDSRGEKLLRKEEREPECGKDFCDACGDCLDCYDGECAYSKDGAHFWVEYESSDTV